VARTPRRHHASASGDGSGLVRLYTGTSCSIRWYDRATSSPDTERLFGSEPPIITVGCDANASVAFFQSQAGFDYSGFSFLEFDLRIDADRDLRVA